jgi:small nuclear ribonucleoprotein (snRNP)-like protein
MNASNTILGCPVLLKLKSNDTFHGIFVTFSPEFDVMLECCHKVDPKNEVMICGRSLPKKSEVCPRLFEIDDIVEISAFEIDKDFAIKSK